MERLPKRLQPILWSKNIRNLDIKKDRVYIINQVLRYGSLTEIAWLKKTYGSSVVRSVFRTQPAKIYSPASYNFITKFVLHLKNIFPSYAKTHLTATPRRSAHRRIRLVAKT